jgi:hypothetical protein
LRARSTREFAEEANERNLAALTKLAAGSYENMDHQARIATLKMRALR